MEFMIDELLCYRAIHKTGLALNYIKQPFNPPTVSRCIFALASTTLPTHCAQYGKPQTHPRLRCNRQTRWRPHLRPHHLPTHTTFPPRRPNAQRLLTQIPRPRQTPQRQPSRRRPQRYSRHLPQISTPLPRRFQRASPTQTAR